jgi:hypothetical protein
MIVVPSKFAYVGSPRTGSHFIYNVLEAHFPKAQRFREHHANIQDVLNVKRLQKLPVYTVVRDPLEQLFSLYWNSLRKYPDRVVDTTFTEFIEGRKPPNVQYNKNIDFPPGALCQYRNVADKFFPFEPNFTTLFKFLGVDKKYDVESTPDLYAEAQQKILKRDKLLLKKYFKKDYEVLEKL